MAKITTFQGLQSELIRRKNVYNVKAAECPTYSMAQKDRYYAKASTYSVCAHLVGQVIDRQKSDQTFSQVSNAPVEISIKETSTPSFRSDLRALINKHSLENESDTPDFVLAAFLIGCLKSFDLAVNVRTSLQG